MEFVMQVMGTLGLVETVVEFTYVITNREKFTPFEEVFFLTSGSIEMLGEVIFLVLGIALFLRDRDCKGITALVRDPIHNCAHYRWFWFTTPLEDVEKESESKILLTAAEYEVWSTAAVFCSLLSLPVWATFWPVWGSLFEDDGDDGLRLALSICSLGLTCMVVLGMCHNSLEVDLVRRGPIFAAYGMEKVFEVYVLLSDLERLCPGDLGKALVGFQTTEIISVAFILACMMWEAVIER